MTTVGAYVRISDDDEREGLGVARQTKDAVDLARREGWEVVETYADNSISAFKRVVRPAFERMLVDLGSGKIDGAVVWDIDRLARQPMDLERLIRLYDDRPSLVFGTCQANIDLATPDGRWMARTLVNFANKTSADMSRRLKRKSLELAQDGKPNGGGTRAYGWKDGGLELEPSEAVIVREAASRILSGESPISICRELDERGVPRPGTSKMWEPSVLKALLIRPRMAGLRQHQGKIMIGDDGAPVRAVWEPLLELEAWEALRTLLTDPEREIGRGKADRKYLLSGILRCQCGAKMYGVFKKGGPNYMCPTYRGCGKTCRRGEPIDRHVEEIVLRHLELEQAEPDPEPDTPLDTEITEAEASLANLIAEWGAGRMSDAVFFAAQAKREATLRGLTAERAKVRRRRALKSPTGPGVREIWSKANISQRRAMVQDVLVAVLVLPKPPGRTPFRAKYYEPQFRKEAG